MQVACVRFVTAGMRCKRSLPADDASLRPGFINMEAAMEAERSR